MADKKASLTLVLGSKVTSAISGIKSVGSAVGNLARQVAKPIMWGGTVGFGAATAASAVAGRAIVRFGANAEQTRLRFQTMLGSIEKGDAMMAKLDRFSNSTPYSGEQVNQAAKTLLGFGVAAGDVEETLRKVGDVASGSGKDFNELAAIYGKVFAKGKMDTEAMNQMVEAGIPIVKTLGSMYGKSGDEIYKMAEKGQITADMVGKAYDQMSGKGGIYANMMQQQSETVSGLWGAVVGQLQYAAANFGESLLPLMKEGLKVLQRWADKIVEMSKDGTLVEWFAKAANVAIEVGTTIAKVFNTAWEIGKVVWTQIGNAAVGTWLGIKSTALTVFAAVGEALNTAGNYIYAVFETIGRVCRMVWNGVASTTANIFAGVVSTVIEAVNVIIGALNKIPGVDLGLVEEPAFVKQIKAYAVEAGDKALEDFEAVTSGADFKEAGERADWQNRDMFGGIRNEADAAGDEAYRLYNEVGQGVQDAVANIKEGNSAIEEFGEKAKAKIADWADSAKAELKKRNDAEKTADLSATNQAVAAARPAGGTVSSIERTQVDSLAKIGLYNFGKYNTRSLDQERNNLLKDILDKIDNNGMEGAALA